MSRTFVTFALLAVAVWAAGATTACQRRPAERRYDLTGQVVAIDLSRLEVTIAHDAVPQYMAAMVMPFTVRERSEVAGLKPGDLVRGTLIVRDEDGYLEAVQRVGFAELPAAGVGVPSERVDYLLEGDRLPDGRLVDQERRVRFLRDEVGKTVVMTFVYTRCPFPTFCPLIDRRFVSLQQEIARTPRLADRVRLLSVTLDPEYDTPDVLRAHAARLHADPRIWSFVRPDDEAAGALPVRFGATAAASEGRSGSEIVHDLVTVIVGPDGVISAILRGNEWKPAEVIALVAPMPALAARD